VEPPKAALVTLGCPMNRVDSERIMSGLVSAGFEIVPEEEADVIVVNTCGFIEDAREESVETILSVAGLKREGRLKSLVVAGCLAERYRSELEEELSEADAIVGLGERDDIPDICLNLLGRGRPPERLYSRVVTGPPHTAYLKIAEGCDNRCSYCAIPMIRGPYRSVPAGEVVREAEELAALGIRELVLVAQDTTNYGAGTDGPWLPGLLERLSEVEGIEWIRLLYAHPARFSDELIESIASLPGVLPYIDMPVQHISRNVLRRMRRPVTPERIYELVETLRKRIDGIVLRTSIMVGFPGETEEDFRELAGFVEAMRFERLGVFVYSPEEGTPAFSMSENVPAETAAARFEKIMEIQAGISEEFHRSLVGREFDMIVDSVASGERSVTGRTYMDAPEIDGTVTARGHAEEGEAFRRVRISGAGTYDLYGEILPGNGSE